MIIYTNEGNPLALKLLLLSKFANREVVVRNVNLTDGGGKAFLTLPSLELDCGVVLFSTNAVAKYLFPHEGVQRDEWLEWCSTMLAPALTHYLAGGHRPDLNSLPVYNSLVKKLDDRLKVSPYVAGDVLSAADISVWAMLAPNNTLRGAKNTENIFAWYRKFSALPEVQDVLSIQPLQNLTYSAIQYSNRYGGLYHVPLRVHSCQLAATNLVTENTAHLMDTITDEELKTAESGFVYVEVTQRDEPRTVLPRPGERNVLITSSLPYVNNVPHLGNIIGCVLSADIYARYARSVGYNTLYICGTDEYGTATENKALAENLTPKEVCDKYYDMHNSIYRWFGIGFDYFGRTTTQEQTEIVQDAFQKVQEGGFILNQSVEQLLCQKCDRFLADRFVEGTCPHLGCGYEDARGDQCDKCGKLVNATELIRPRCKVCNTAPVLRSSEQLFLDLPQLEKRLYEWVKKSEVGWTNNARVITRAWLREGLKPRCITRDLKWGIPVPQPGFENKVFYVWFDAPFGYHSITKRYTKDYLQWWQPANDVKVEYFQFMAKDNVPFHAVMWPATLLAMNSGHTLVSHIMATEYLNYEDGKFSKSRGIGVFGNDAQDTGIPADVWRFYLATARPEAQDSSFSWNDLASRNNSELLNNLGNFVNRALVFCEKNFNSIVPPIKLSNAELALIVLINRELWNYVNALEKARLRDGARHLLCISRNGNGYLQVHQPWALLKGTPEQLSRAATIIGVCCNVVCLLATMIFPYMPTTSRALFGQLNTNPTVLNTKKPFMRMFLKPGHKMGKPFPLFSKLEPSFIDGLKKKYSGPQVTTDCTCSDAAQVESKAHQKPKEEPKYSKEDCQKTGLAVDKDNVTLKPPFAPKSTNGVQSNSELIKQLEEAIQKQGEKVRQLKATTKDKTVWQPEVNTLLDLKKQLQVRQESPKTTTPAPIVPSIASPQSTLPMTIQALEAEVIKQGEHVRNLKATASLSVWKPEFDHLLLLKKQLIVLQERNKNK